MSHLALRRTLHSGEPQAGIGGGGMKLNEKRQKMEIGITRNMGCDSLHPHQPAPSQYNYIKACVLPPKKNS